MTIERNQNQEKKKVGVILDKLNYQEKRIKNKRETIEKELMFKHEKEFIKRKNKEIVLERLSNIQEYNNELNKRKIEDKIIRAEEIKSQKMMISMKKKKMAEDISKQKNEILNKFEKLVKKNTGVTVS